MQHLQKTGGRVPVMVNQPDAEDFAASASLLQSAPAIGKITGRKTRLDPRRAPSGAILRQTRIHSRRRLRSRRRFGQTPSQQRPRPRQNPPATPSPPRPRPPHLRRLRFTPREVEGLLPFTLSPQGPCFSPALLDRSPSQV